LTLFAAGFPAKTSATQELEKDWKVNGVDFGANTSESLAYYDQDTSSWKTSQLSLDGESTEFAETWPASGIVRSGKLFARPTFLCLTVENESALLPTPTRSFGVNARGWGLSQTGRLRYSKQMQANALQFGYRPPITLLEWMMGFPENYTDLGPNALGTQLSQQPLNGSLDSSSSTISRLGICMTENSLTFSQELTFAEWESVGSELFRVEAAWQWWVGDWLNYGEKKYGQTYEQALALTGKSLKTLQDVKWVAATFKSSDRSELSWTHHRVAVSMPTDVRKEVLNEAEQNKLSVKWVREKAAEITGKQKQNDLLSKVLKQLERLTREELQSVRDEIDSLLNDKDEA
jgi:hypothetical protein